MFFVRVRVIRSEAPLPRLPLTWGDLSEPAAGRALAHQVTTIPFNSMTVDLCTAACRDADFVLAGVEYAGECCV